MELDNIAIININEDNIDKEHVCCAINEKKGETCVKEKKDWLKERFKEGLMFKRLDARGKFFIEYIPAEYAWVPVTAPNYMYINCFWVSGKYKGHGHAGRLLNECIEDAKAKGKSGLAILSSSKKKPFLCDPKFLKHKGFQIADTASPYYELLYLNFDENSSADLPKFNESVKNPDVTNKGFEIIFTNQCPYAEKYANIIKNTAINQGFECALRKISSREEAQRSPIPFTTYSLFYNGEFITNEMQSDRGFIKMLDKMGIKD